jgi:two-component system, OmpR family, phosphate regulon sensor histidine kinase PhoR
LSRLSRISDSYRARLILGYALVAAVFALAWGWSLYGPLQQGALRQQQRSLTALAQSDALYAAETTATVGDIAKRLTAGTDIRLTIIASDGKVIVDSQNNAASMENHANRPEVAAALGGQVGTDQRSSATEGTKQLYVAVPGVLDGRRVALRVSEPLADINAVAQTAQRLGLILLIAALGIAIGIAAWASAAAARPIQDLSAIAERMAAGNLSTEVPPVPTDLQVLANALETLRRQMRSRLDALESEQRTLRTALDGLSDAVFLLEGDRILFANDAAGRIFHTPGSGWRGTAIDGVGLPASLSSAICERLGSVRAYATELEPDPLGRPPRTHALSPSSPMSPSAHGSSAFGVTL